MAEKILKTTLFSWEGTDKKGAKVKGDMSGANPALVKAQLRKQGINPTKVRKKGTSLFSKGKKIKPLDIALFTRQMATMMKAGVPLLQSFDIIGEGVDNQNMRKLVEEVKQEVAAGNSFANSLRKSLSTLTSSTATWSTQANNPAHWKICWIAWQLTKRKPSHSRQRSRRR